MNLNAYETADQKVARMIREACLNAASHLLRIYLVTAGLAKKPEDLTGIERDFLVSVVFSMNECVAVLNTLGGTAHLDAIALTDPDVFEYYVAAVTFFHNNNQKSPELQGINKAFEAAWLRIKPEPVQPEAKKKRDAQLEKEFGPEDDVPAKGANGTAKAA